MHRAGASRSLRNGRSTGVPPNPHTHWSIKSYELCEAHAHRWWAKKLVLEPKSLHSMAKLWWDEWKEKRPPLAGEESGVDEKESLLEMAPRGEWMRRGWMGEGWTEGVWSSDPNTTSIPNLEDNKIMVWFCRPFACGVLQNSSMLAMDYVIWFTSTCVCVRVHEVLMPSVVILKATFNPPLYPLSSGWITEKGS